MIAVSPGRLLAKPAMPTAASWLSAPAIGATGLDLRDLAGRCTGQGLGSSEERPAGITLLASGRAYPASLLSAALHLRLGVDDPTGEELLTLLPMLAAGPPPAPREHSFA